MKIIINNDKKRPQYWNNRWGWGRKNQAEIFSDMESTTLNLPIGGRWVDDNTYKVFTKCDLGDKSREDVIGRHKSYSTAAKQYARLWKIYHLPRGTWKVWQIDMGAEYGIKAGREI
jgi:hypothetical protein